MATRASRSRSGCQTCKRRRRKCDEQRPECGVCCRAGIVCGGYARQLQWGVGIASRGRYRGASVPVPESVPERVTRGRQRDVIMRARRADGGEESAKGGAAHGRVRRTLPRDCCSAPSAGILQQEDSQNLQPGGFSSSVREQQLFQDFVQSGQYQLFSTDITDSPISQAIQAFPAYISQSRALYYICICIQLHLRQNVDSESSYYYGNALRAFREELDDPVRTQHDGTLASAIFLCTVGIITSTDWTIHLHGANSILENRLSHATIITTTATLDSPSPTPPLSAMTSTILEALGYMDLSPFTLGRKSPSLNIWTRHCRRSHPASTTTRYEDDDHVEPVSGLPCSLIDAFAGIDDDGDDDCEQRFWDWKGYPGEPLQCQLWEAYRFAGILDARARRRRWQRSSASSASASASTETAVGRPRAAGASTTLVLSRLVSAVDALHRGIQAGGDGGGDGGDRRLLVVNALVYPLWHAGVEIKPVDGLRRWHGLVDGWWALLAQREGEGRMRDLAWAYAACCEERRAGRDGPVDDIVRARGVEVALV